MRAHRGKQIDWNKPFKIISSKVQFESLDAGDNQLVVSLNSKTDTNAPPIDKKQEIIVPKIQIVRRITEPKKFAKLDPNYLRITEQLNLPKLMSYELNEVDHVFLQGQSSKFRFNGKPIITPEFLSGAFIELETRAGKDHVLPRVKTWMMQYIQRQHKQLLAMPNVQQFAEVFYNYWKNRRQQLKFPMLRPLWRPNPEQYSHLLAFKPRQKDKRSLRRTSRIAEDQIAQDLEDQFNMVVQMSERIKLRQQLKLKQLQLSFTNFNNQCKQYFETSIFDNPNFISPFEPQLRVKDKQKLRLYQQEVDNVKREQLQEEKQHEFELIAQQQTYDQKKSIVNFLSTVAYYAQCYGVSYEKIFHDRGSTVNNNSRTQIKPPTNISININPKEPEVDMLLPIAEKPQCLQFTPYRHGDMIYRVLEQEQSEPYQDQLTQNNTEEISTEALIDKKNKIKLKPPGSLLEYYTMGLKCYSFGDQQEGDDRDLRRITSQNFKRFQQLMRN